MNMRNCKSNSKGVTLLETIVSISIIAILFSSIYTSIFTFNTMQKEVYFKDNLVNTLENIILDVQENPNEYKYFRRIYLNEKGLEYPYESNSYIEIICVGEKKLEFTIRVYKDNSTFHFPLSENNIVDEIKVYVYE